MVPPFSSSPFLHGAQPSYLIAIFGEGIVQGTGLQALGYGLLAIILSLLIIPAAWGAVAVYKWFVSNLSFSDGTEASFAGRGGEIWGYFALAMIIGILSSFVSIISDSPRFTRDLTAFLALIFLRIVLLLISIAIGLRILRWFIRSVHLSCGTALNFTGTYGPFLGWIVLYGLSLLTIIGWAWVVVAAIRWLYRHVEGGQHHVMFEGGGWGVLWRTIITVLASFLVIPIPWMTTWLIQWYVRNTVIQRLPA